MWSKAWKSIQFSIHLSSPGNKKKPMKYITKHYILFLHLPSAQVVAQLPLAIRKISSAPRNKEKKIKLTDENIVSRISASVCVCVYLFFLSHQVLNSKCETAKNLITLHSEWTSDSIPQQKGSPRFPCKSLLFSPTSILRKFPFHVHTFAGRKLSNLLFDAIKN